MPFLSSPMRHNTFFEIGLWDEDSLLELDSQPSESFLEFEEESWP